MVLRFCMFCALMVPMLAHSGLLHYDLEFEASDSEHSVTGNGFLMADTELDAIVGGQLVCDEFVFSWSDGSPEMLTWLDQYYGADVVSGGTAIGIDELTGAAGTFDLMFLLWPVDADGNFADELQNHFSEDVWSTLNLASDARPEDHWLNSSVQTYFTVDAPVNVLFAAAETEVGAATMVAEVAAPSSIPLMLLGVTLLMLRRRRAAA